MYFVNLTTTRQLDGREDFEVVWGIGNKVVERTDDISSILDAEDAAQHFLYMLFARGCSAVRTEYTYQGPGVAEDFTDVFVEPNIYNFY